MNELYELYQQAVLVPFFSAFAHFARFVGFDPGTDYYNWFVAISLIQVATFVLFIILVRFSVSAIKSLLGRNVGKNYDAFQRTILSNPASSSSADYCVYAETSTKFQDLLRRIKPLLILVLVVLAAMIFQLIAYETMSPWFMDYDPLTEPLLDAYCHWARIIIVIALIAMAILAIRKIARFLIKRFIPVFRSSRTAMRLGRQVFKPRIRLRK